MDANLIIDIIGGTTKVAEICDLTTGAVSQWRKNGIPKPWILYLRLLHPEVFDREEERTPSEQAA